MMGPFLRFIAALTLLAALVSLLQSGAPIPIWLAAILFLGGIFLLLVRGNLARRLITVLSAIALLTVYAKRLGGFEWVSLIGVLALIMLAGTYLLSPFFKGRW